MKKLRGYCARASQFLLAHQTAYGRFSAGVLLVSTLCWSAASARLQQGNADQLADGFLFENSHTFGQALFPVEHTLLFKWPLFELLKLLHYSAGAYETLTVLAVLVTVGAFALLLYKINSRPLFFGTVFLGLACVLTLVPAQIFDGFTAPLNMALLTGRNLEYVTYVGVLVLYLQAQNFRNWRWVVATLTLCVLLASDQLFISLGIGGAAILAVAAYWRGHKQLLSLAWRWLAGSAMAWAGAKVLLRLIGANITGLATDTSGPSGLSGNWHSFWPATQFAAKALALNFGVTARSGGWTFLSAVANLLLMTLAGYACYQVVRRMVRESAGPVAQANALSAMLITSALAAFVAYVATNHPYEADARYLTIAIFASFVTLATFARSVRVQPQKMLVAGGFLLLAVAIGLIATCYHGLARDALADSLAQRNRRIAAVLQKHPEQVLVGDYWRVEPIRSITPNARQAIVPLRSCVQPVESLRSDAWLHDLRQTSFAYVLSLRSSGTPFQRCGLHTIEFVYGPPSSVVYIAGDCHNPIELLLLYDNGAAQTGH